MPSSPSSTNSDPLVSRPVQVMQEALRAGRLSHSLIVSGEQQEPVEKTGQFMAEQILARHPTAVPLNRHPDFFALRPTGKMRQISAANTRELIRNLHHSSNLGGGKVALLFEADRMHLSAANIFLKTLEEPPADTTIILLTSRPHFLLPTIRSRCLHFRLPAAAGLEDFPEPLLAWLSDYTDWLEGFSENLETKKDICHQMIGLYGLLSRFSPLLKAAVTDMWKAQKESLPENLTDEEEQAIEEGMRIGIRDKLFGALEHRMRAFARTRLEEDGAAGAFTAAVSELERMAGLLRVNLRETPALEGFLLAAMRHWGRRR